MDAPNSLRYEVTVADINGKTSTYRVASLFGPYKAVAMAISAHMSKARSHRIYKVEVSPLPGSKLQPKDLVDRLEW